MPDTLTVNLGPRSYPIRFGADLNAEVRAQVATLSADGRRVVVINDINFSTSQALGQVSMMDAMFGSQIISIAVPIPEGGINSESRKSLGTLEYVLNEFRGYQLDRRAVVFAFGGGVIGDLAGFVAAIWLRGVDFYQIPTTLLAMVDSSVGGKTGINLAAGKNLVGAFHQPKGVFISTNLLSTLPSPEFNAGCAEIIKAGLLGDAELFARLERAPLTLASADLAAVIRRCCALKARVVEADEFETAKDGGRALLNLGHTFGHAIEQVAGYGKYLHGEAVAIGLCAAARLSEKLGMISAADVERVKRVVEIHKLPSSLSLKPPLAFSDLKAAMARDKKVRAGKLRFVVLKSLGEAVTRDDVPDALAEACFREVGAV